MAELTDTRRRAWQPPPRPDWVTRINAEGACMDLDAVVPLDEASLFDAARRRTGLTDFGPGEWHESFRVFIRSLREESALNLMGRLMTRSDLVNMLAARLQIEDTYRRHPEIEDEEIRSPFMIVGQARTGTSLLLNVMSEDPANAAMRHWECVFPCPPPERETYFSDPRIEVCDAQVEMWNRVNPDLPTCHEFNARVPTEASHAMTLAFAGAPYLSMLGQTPSHGAWMHARGAVDGLRYQKRLLKLLQWKNPRERWILKAPDALVYMPELLQVYPDMNFIWTHRDPLKAADSVANMYGNCMWTRSDHIIGGDQGVIEQMTNADNAAAVLNQAIDWIDTGVVPPARICNLRFLELEREPVAAVETVYAHFGITLSDTARAAMQRYMELNPRTARPPARYKRTTGAGIGAEREALRRYLERFGIESEE